MALDLDVSLLDAPYSERNGLIATAPPDAFEPDSNNPRLDTNVDPDFDADIKENGILQPIVVCEEGGKLKIRFGHRRYYAALRVGIHAIPYVITEDPRHLDDYAQVAENEQRKGLSPLELATFIQRRIDKGDKKKYIAKRLHIDPSAITHLLALLNAPPFILELYHSNKCRSPKYLYTLCNLHKEDAEAVERYFQREETVDQRVISRFIDLQESTRRLQKSKLFSNDAYHTPSSPSEPEEKNFLENSKKTPGPEDFHISRPSNPAPEIEFLEISKKPEKQGIDFIDQQGAEEPTSYNDDKEFFSVGESDFETTIPQKENPSNQSLGLKIIEIPKDAKLHPPSLFRLYGTYRDIAVEIIPYVLPTERGTLVIRPLNFFNHYHEVVAKEIELWGLVEDARAKDI